MNWLTRLAAASAVPVYPAVGADALVSVEDLALDPRISVVASPRHASLLLVAGEIGFDHLPALRRLHDQLPHPRATIWWNTAPDPEFGHSSAVADDTSVEAAILEAYRALLDRRRQSEKDLLPDEPPVPWRGKGKNGQGGDGMMGGNPYGRPMAMTDDDMRDGLALDAYTASFGPFLPMFPPGLVLDVTLQGDVIQKAEVRHQPFSQKGTHDSANSLRRIARILRILGLAAPAEHFYRSALALALGDAVDVHRLWRSLRWTGALKAIPDGLAIAGPEGWDVRRRVSDWFDGALRPPEAGAPDQALSLAPNSSLGVLLTGLEWHEAMLVLNSFDNDDLLAICALSTVQAKDDDHSEHKA